MVFKTFHKCCNILFIIKPVLFKLLYLSLGFAQSFIELFNILMRIEQLTIVSDFFEVDSDGFIKLFGFLDHDFLDGE